MSNSPGMHSQNRNRRIARIYKLMKGKSGVAVGKVNDQLITIPLKHTWTKRKKLNPFLLKLIPILAT
jgi:hypothetical protein